MKPTAFIDSFFSKRKRNLVEIILSCSTPPIPLTPGLFAMKICL